MVEKRHQNQLQYDVKNVHKNFAGADPGKDGDGEDAEVESQLPGSDPAFRFLPLPSTFAHLCFFVFLLHIFSFLFDFAMIVQVWSRGAWGAT